MRKLTDVYIKVTNSNVKDLMKQINRYDLEPYTYVFFAYDSIKGNKVSLIEPKNRKKVSLAELKRLIDTIPTREEITRLKRQIGGYKTNYDKVVKHSLSKEDVIEHLEKKLDIQADLIRDKNAQIAKLKQRKWWQIWK